MKKRTLAVSDKDAMIAERAHKIGHKTLAFWARACAERALPFFEKTYQQDDRPRRAIDAAERG